MSPAIVMSEDISGYNCDRGHIPRMMIGRGPIKEYGSLMQATEPAGKFNRKEDEEIPPFRG